MDVAPLSTATAEAREALPPPVVRGKFLFAGDEKLYLKGVTYGTFPPNRSGEPYPEPERVARDFARMAVCGVNSLRTYTVPPAWLLDLASEHGLRVMVGLPWEQHVAFLEDGRRERAIRRRARERVRAVAGHPALLAFALGNEIPAPIVRWHGRRRIERFLERLGRDVREEAPGALVTYVNYPTTEYLELPFVDFVAFNVYLESTERFEAYLARLHNLAGDRPLVMAEIGLDSRRNGLERQAEALEEQIRAAFAAGCAGTYAFAWSDAWHRGGVEVTDWDFGLVARSGRPKPALEAVRRAYGEVPFPRDPAPPSASVVVCSYNGARTLGETLRELERVDYPDLEVIVVDDGSTDGTARVAETFDVRLIRTPNRGLSAARNTGLEAASGEVVAYLDDDAWPDPHWLRYLVEPLREAGAVGAGGPNLPPPDDPPVARCVAQAPGGPAHVLLDDRDAEHVPGCNMAFRRDALLAAGGFDPRFRVAGDDVDACWRLLDAGGRIAFHPAAVVWHRRRDSVRAYLKQQVGYGRAETLLARKWPERYSPAGHAIWGGRVYGPGAALLGAGRIYGGTWGGAPFQRLYRAPGSGASPALLPEWPLLVAALALLTALGALWPPYLLAAPLLLAALAPPLAHATRSAARAPLPPVRRREALAMRVAIAALHALQPAARLLGRLERAPRRPHGPDAPRAGWAAPRPRTVALWREERLEPDAWREALEGRASAALPVRRGGDWDRWDLELRGGALGGVRALAVVEEHGDGRQLARFRLRPWVPRPVRRGAPALLAAALAAGALGAWGWAAALALPALLAGAGALRAAGAAMAVARRALEGLEGSRRV